MPTPAYMTIEGTRQGLISAGALGEESVGNASQLAYKDKVLVQALSHSIAVPGGGRWRQPSSAQASGDHQND